MRLASANAVPVVVAKLVGHRWAAPLDFGWILPDGERLFGSHKTWRGLASGVVACTLVGLLLDLRPIVSAGFGCASLMADALSSAAKRRRHFEPGTEHVGLDQIGEALLPLALFARPLSLGLGEVIAVTALSSCSISLPRNCAIDDGYDSGRQACRSRQRLRCFTGHSNARVCSSQPILE